MTLSDLSIERPVLTWMMMVALGVFGVLGYGRLGVDQFPEMDFPVVTVDAELEGATPEGVEEDVTDPLEERFTTISGVRTIRSSSFQGAARIEVEFVLGTDLDVAVQDVRDQVAQAMAKLPEGIETPAVTRSGGSDRAILYAPFFSELPLVEVSEYVERVVKPQLDTIPGVAGAIVFGKRERNIRIWVDSQKLRARGLAAGDLIRAIGREHVDRPAGFIPSVVDPDPSRNLFAAGGSSVLSYGMKRDFNAWLVTLGNDAPVQTLTELREWNEAHRNRGTLKYDQARLDGADAIDLEEARAQYEEDRARDLFLNAEHGIDAAMDEHELDALLFPGNGSAAIAARPGYPTVIVPFGMIGGGPDAAAGFPEGFEPLPRPFGVSFTGSRCAEPTLLGLAYAFEQATMRRNAPPRMP